MDPARELRSARRTAGLTQRELAALSGTSQATISAYESGAKAPSLATTERLLRACGVRLEVRGRPGGRSHHELERAGRELAEVLALAEALPYRPRRQLQYPRLVR